VAAEEVVSVAESHGDRGHEPGQFNGDVRRDAGRTAHGRSGDGEDTRERILDVALDLFVDKGYDSASLREIAEQMGFSKAALYYHFASKGDIFFALHLRLHQSMDRLLADLGPGLVDLATWEHFLDRAVDEMLANRKLFAMHQRNQNAFQDVHAEHHHEEHVEIEERMRSLWTDPNTDPQLRFRMAASFAAGFATIMMAGDVFDQLGTAEAGDMVRAVIHDVLAPVREAPDRSESATSAADTAPPGPR
jgi:AcrR family transcriptional regulator